MLSSWLLSMLMLMLMLLLAFGVSTHTVTSAVSDLRCHRHTMFAGFRFRGTICLNRAAGESTRGQTFAS